MKSFIAGVLIGLALVAASSWSWGANENSCSHGGACTGQGGQGGKGGDGGNAAAVAVASGGAAKATSGDSSATTGRVISLGAAAVGSPAADTCAAYVAVGFGLITAPTSVDSCVAIQQALMLERLGLKDAAIARLCQLDSIYETGICPARAKSKTVLQE